ncbi:MAG TPA: hypothetical protein EYP23_01225 [Thermoplasmata archaeon]|nr:hypothetical protein [Thermoplasmata archaeon]
MKKTMGILFAAELMLMMPITAIAASSEWLPGESRCKECCPADEVVRQKICGRTLNTVETQYGEQLRNRLLTQQEMENKLEVRFRGIWGFTGDNETSGYFAGVITKRGRVAWVHGVWNTSDNENHGRLVGIMKHGYFNGRVSTGDETMRHVTGLYKINREKHVLRMRWITPHQGGWAVAKLSRQLQQFEDMDKQ